MTCKAIKFTNSLAIVLLAAIARKIWLGYHAMQFVQSCDEQVNYETMIASKYLVALVSQLPQKQETLILMLNRHAVNMTFNWLCNTQHMPAVHHRSLIVTLDKESHEQIKAVWPEIRLLHWPVPCLRDPFNYGDGCYQLFYLFRANFARVLLHANRTFWMIQQDTFWRRSLLDIDLSANSSAQFNDADIIFDRASETDGSLISGGYYLVRPTAGSKSFFHRLSENLSWRYVPDNAMMTALCADNHLVKCQQIPYSNVISDEQVLIQFDGYTATGGKLDAMRNFGFYFLNNDGETCNESLVEIAQRQPLSSRESGNTKSLSHWQFGFYQSITDLLYKTRFTEMLMNRFVFPNSHYFMITF